MTSPSSVPALAILVASAIACAGTPCATDWAPPGAGPVALARRAPSAVVAMGTATVFVGKLRVCARGCGDGNDCCRVGHRPDSAMGHGDLWSAHSPQEWVRGEEEGKRQAPLPVPSCG